jgi:hypothetical protein
MTVAASHLLAVTLSTEGDRGLTNHGVGTIVAIFVPPDSVDLSDYVSQAVQAVNIKTCSFWGHIYQLVTTHHGHYEQVA